MKYLYLLLLCLFCSCLAAPSFAQKKKNASPKPTIARADSLSAAGKSADAISVYEAALKDPVAAKDASAWFRLGTAYYNMKEYNKSLVAFGNARRINGKFPGIRLGMARTYSALNNNDRVVELMDSAISIGFSNYKTIESDPGFENLRKDPRFKGLRERMMANAYPCLSLPQARQFDFWLGEWNVYPTASLTGRVGTNEVTRAAEGCLIVESWESSGPHNGMSLNYYDPTSGKWQQKWVGSSQDITEFTDGVYSDGAMRFKFIGRNPDGTSFTGRLTFTDMDGKVRQHSERTNDNGATWQTNYDFTYIRKAPGEMP